MKVLVATPPNYVDVVKAFPSAADHGTVFTFGDTLYNPSGIVIKPWLRAHEGVHIDRQLNLYKNPERWWDQYLVSAEFRLREELPAHKAEFKVFRDLAKKNNWDVEDGLKKIAERLCSPLYGSLISYNDARSMLAK